MNLKKQLLTVKNIALFTQMSQSSIMDDIRSGKLPAMQYSKRGKWLIAPDDADTWLESKKYKSNSEAERASTVSSNVINMVKG